MKNFNKNILFTIFNNDEKLYTGNDLWYYAKKVFFAKNSYLGYHNFRHTMHVLIEVYDAIKVMKVGQEAARRLLIAVIFHDYGHTGNVKNSDTVNIQLAVKGFKRHAHPEDKKHPERCKRIITLLKSTEWIEGVGHNIFEDELDIRIIRDADMSQTFSGVWMQQVIFGLGAEKGLSRRAMLGAQRPFLETKVKFLTPWGKEKFSPILKQRIEELKVWEEKFL